MNRIRLTASASALAAALLLSPVVVTAQTPTDTARVNTQAGDNDDNEGFDKGLLGLLGLLGLAGLRRRPDHAHVHVDRDVTTSSTNYSGPTGTTGTPGSRRP